MKKQLSVFALHTRAAIGRLALVLLGMLALDALVTMNTVVLVLMVKVVL